MRALMETMLARATGRGEHEVRRDVERDKIFSAREAKEYGLIDDVVTSRKPSARAVLATVGS